MSDSGLDHLSDHDKLIVIDRLCRQILRDHSAVVQGLEQMRNAVRRLEDWKTTMDTRDSESHKLSRRVMIWVGAITTIGTLLIQIWAAFHGQKTP